MYDYAIMWEWGAFAIRWLHVITAIAWIGSSFYFIALDLGLRKAPDLPEGAHGEEWQVHGGGFYHIRKYLVAPAAMPEHLTWFKWESYATWLSGFALLAVVYYAGADLYLVDANVWDVSPFIGILTSIASIIGAWLVYDLLCKSPLKANATALMVLLFALLVGLAWFYTQIFTGRAAFLHLGAITATIMSANVFMVIIPNQKIVVADLKAGRVPDAKYGKIAKLRSTHNNYLTLPVLFLMLSNHYPLAFATQYNWIIASLVFLIGVTIRHYFNSVHARKGKPNWTWALAAILFIIIAWLSTVPAVLGGDERAALPERAQRMVAAAGFEDVSDIVLGRCSMCHSATPAWEGMLWPPKGVMLETEAQIALRAREIYLQAGRSHAMPPANITYMSDEERQQIVAWFEGISNGG
ncbi:urate hydroxylase PuuD [Abyssibius alkaniclasticus]|uniref:urate hydroxylase PuuD n=1 Tax=Abyssibius alkaniclasticus TaxID=2881234 RepID=UPI002363CD12|nr:urate hydroxylase PuuD [Abyssibius alkaniclasticus]UPH69806.1 urate hydroxylase PuuD [Abyssibius alkaniclasticus]